MAENVPATTSRQLAPLSKVDPKDILERYLAGETGPQIAQSLGVTKQALSFFLISKAEEDWRAAQLVKAIDRKDRADELIETADNALDLTRAREMLRSAQWDLERVCRRIYGQDVPGVSSAVQININLRRESATNAVQHEPIQVEVSKDAQ
jgi:hypothetical protein